MIGAARCDCADCRSRRLAWRLFLGFMAALVVAAALSRPAHAETVMACVKVALPGPGNTLNPHDPPARRRQDIIKLCAPYPVEDKRPHGPVLDYRHDVRVFA